MNTFEIPLISQPQTLSVTLSGVAYQLSIAWNAPSQTWMLDIADITGNPIVRGIALVPGCDLLGQYDYLGFVGGLVVFTDDGTLPTFDNLGSNAALYYVTL